MLLAHLPNRSPFARHHPPADRSLEAPHLPFTLICRDADNRIPVSPSTATPISRTASTTSAWRSTKSMTTPTCAIPGAPTPSMTSPISSTSTPHGEHRLSVTTTGYEVDETGPWWQVWDFLGKPFVLFTPDTDPSRFPRHLSVLTAHRHRPSGSSQPCGGPFLFAGRWSFRKAFARQIHPRKTPTRKENSRHVR